MHFEYEPNDDEDFDVTAIYVLGKDEFDLGSPEMTEKINRSMEQGLREVRRRHKEAGVPMVISRDGKIIYLQPDEIEID